jgi:hypothetical protein
MRECMGSVATKRTRLQVFDLTRVEQSCTSAKSINFEIFNKLSGLRQRMVLTASSAGVKHSARSGRGTTARHFLPFTPCMTLESDKKYSILGQTCQYPPL